MHMQVCHSAHTAFLLFRLSQHDAYPGGKLFKGKRLHQVIISSQIQPSHPVLHTIPGSEKQYRRSVLFPPHRLKDLQTIRLRHHNIQDHRIIPGAGQTVQGLLPIDAGIHAVAFGSQLFHQQAVQITFILGNQYAHPATSLQTQ